ncbi:hypothetical protein HNY73_004414 [Argiope bruennichi]|uniref:Uncharacterized protein n=1 Tax=Argiope bruennichi TaxID=94029 RepID=A0A8T0FNW6_ARGBR|nr:hypothetical protein HNY73_004414 [Argiope bruennichi]
MDLGLFVINHGRWKFKLDSRWGSYVNSSVWIPCFLTSHIFLKSCMECKEVWSVDGVKRSQPPQHSSLRTERKLNY